MLLNVRDYALIAISGVHNKFVDKKLQTTFGLIQIKAPYLFCKKCNSFFDPYATILNLKSGKYQYDIQKVAAKIASSIPFAEAADILKDTHGLHVSQDTLHELTNELGEQVRKKSLPSQVRFRRSSRTLPQGKNADLSLSLPRMAPWRPFGRKRTAPMLEGKQRCAGLSRR